MGLPRLVAPGTLHHVIVRGMEKRRIVDDRADREALVSRMGEAAGVYIARACADDGVQRFRYGVSCIMRVAPAFQRCHPRFFLPYLMAPMVKPAMKRSRNRL